MGMSTMKLSTKGLGNLVRRVQDVSKVGDSKKGTRTPFFNSKVLNITMASTRSWPIIIDHIDSSKIVNMKDSSIRLSVPKIREYRTQIFRPVPTWVLGVSPGCVKIAENVCPSHQIKF